MFNSYDFRLLVNSTCDVYVDYLDKGVSVRRYLEEEVRGLLRMAESAPWADKAHLAVAESEISRLERAKLIRDFVDGHASVEGALSNARRHAIIAVVGAQSWALLEEGNLKAHRAYQDGMMKGIEFPLLAKC